MEVPGEFLNGVVWENDTLTADSKMTLFTLPMSVRGGYGKDFMEGLANDRNAQFRVENNYGKDVKIWMWTVMKAVECYPANDIFPVQNP